MKIAYLILAHNQPAHLSRLVKSLDNKNAEFIIHIDAKANITDFFRYEFPETAHFIEDRIEVNHGGFSLVRAMINLMNNAIKMDDFDYCQTLSGWDYPIKSNEFIYDYLYKHYPMNFLNFYRLTGHADFVENIQKYYFTDTISSAPKLFTKPLKVLQYFLKNCPLNRTFLSGITPFRGSTWFCLNKATLYYITDYLNTRKGKNYTNYFKAVQCADEIFFHTIVLNSPFAEYCRFYSRDAHSHLRNENHAYLHYIDWDQSRENPAILDLRDLPLLQRTPALYARKFHEKKSSHLLNVIDHQRTTNNEEPISHQFAMGLSPVK